MKVLLHGMRVWVAFGLVLAGLPLHGQTAISPYRALRPIMPDPNQRNAPSSVSSADLGSNETAAAAPSKRAVGLRVDPSLAPSKLKVLGTIEGIKGTLYVTNVGPVSVTPSVQLMVCDTRGGKVGMLSKIGEALAAGDSEKIEVLATNLNAADLKLMKLAVAQNR
ncbi:MAG: hypothetical protein ACLQVY_27725 [Limisphaerales bacterium]